MKRIYTIAILGSWLALALAPSDAAFAADGNSANPSTQATGSISGRVQNVATGQFLNKARVSVKGSDLVTFTDALGAYRLVNVPTGRVVLDVFYTDLDPQAIPLSVARGQSLIQDVGLTSVARYGHATDPVKLERFVVASNKETDGEAIATNEKRFSPNIKDVIATDSLGDILGGNVGEFLKYIPGLTAEYAEMDVAGISVRGIGGGMTAITTDGAVVVTANNTPTRSVDIRGMALNNVSRIEVTKVPTPSTPADSLAGSVNMVTKSAFDRSRAQLRYGLSLLGNSENLTLGKRPYSNGDRTVRVLRPGADIDYTLPFGKNFGIAANGMHSERFSEQHISRSTYSTSGTGTGASISRPYMQAHSLLDGPRRENRTLLSLKADWRVTPNSVLSFGVQWNRYLITIGNNTLATNVGTNGVPTPASGVPLTFGDTFSNGATGRGTVTLTSTGNHADERTTSPAVNYRFDDGRWRAEAGISQTASTRVRADADHGSFASLTATLLSPVRVTFSDINPDHPGAIRAFDASNREVDIRDLRNYRISGAATGPIFTRDAEVKAAYLNLRRRLDYFRFPTALQIGGSHRIQTVDTQSTSPAYSYAGPDGNLATIEDATPYRAQVYTGQDADYGFGRNLPWISAARAWAAFQANPVLFPQTAAQVVSQESSRLTNSEYLEESVSAYYLQAEATLLKNRLKVLTGVRFEKTTDQGQGMLSDPNAAFRRNADGTFARDAAGNRLRKPEAGAVGSMAELALTSKERGYDARRTYDGYYPSLHFTFNASENILVRAAYARTYGRPDFTDIVPRTIVNEGDLNETELLNPEVIRGTLNIRNTGLRPWTADNYDLSFEYYTNQGGIFSAGVFLKEIENFFGNAVKVATAADLQGLGLPPQYVGWSLSTKFNSGDARVSGVEFNVRHSLRELGGWGRFFTVFANGTKLRLQGSAQANFTSFIPESANWGVSFNRQRITVMTKWNYRGQDKRGALPELGVDGFEYIGARTKLDLNLAYQLTPRLSLIFSAINLLNEPHRFLRYGKDTPGYARKFSAHEYGVPFSLGIKGTF